VGSPRLRPHAEALAPRRPRTGSPRRTRLSCRRKSRARIAGSIPGVRFVVLRDCGHFAYLEQPAETQREIAQASPWFALEPGRFIPRDRLHLVECCSPGGRAPWPHERVDDRRQKCEAALATVWIRNRGIQAHTRRGAWNGHIHTASAS
jgi:hypothetical protein